jgi:exonuclease SbcD
VRILHTSDWHLGKKLYKKERVEEHQLFLQWLLEQIPANKIEVLVIAGDVFDTPIPTTTSLTLFFKFLKDLESYSEDKGGPLKKVLILAGNHDSAKLLESPRPFLNQKFIKVVGSLRAPDSLEEKDILAWQHQYGERIIKDNKEYFFCLLPFFRTREILDNPWLKLELENKSKLEKEEISIDETLLLSLELFLKNLTPSKENIQLNQKKILIGHHLFGSFISAGSEQSVALSGLDSLPLTTFQNWDLLLLGHIHKYQVVRKDPPAIYCGSPSSSQI